MDITPHHRGRLAVVYVRTATIPGSTADHARIQAQRDQAARARAWGWPETAILVIEDIGRSGSSAEGRPGWQRLLNLVGQGQVGMLLASDYSRLTRSCTDFMALCDLCKHTQTLLVVGGEEYRPDSADALVQSLSGIMQEYDRLLRTQRFLPRRRTGRTTRRGERAASGRNAA